jgi:hypothetical protein
MTVRNLIAIALLAAMLAIPAFYATTSEACATCGEELEYGVVVEGTVSEAAWQQLLRAGWEGRAGDMQTALYSPAPLSNDHYYNLRDAIASGCMMHATFHEDLSCNSYLISPSGV